MSPVVGDHQIAIHLVTHHLLEQVGHVISPEGLFPLLYGLAYMVQSP